MTRIALIALAVLAADDRKYATAWCDACGWYMPIGHGCQGGNGR